MKALEPPHYVDPRIGTHLRPPNAVEAFLSEPSGDGTGALGIVLAEPGQGKSYMSQYVVHRLATIRGETLVPVLVDATQWQSMPEEDLSDLWKTIAHSFRFYEVPIGWVEGHEEAFIQAACRTDLFRIVFDGFDEFILRNRGRVDPMEVLDSLSELANQTGARVVITSRTSFWNTNLSKEQTEAFVERTGSEVFPIRPFDLSTARDYFSGRFRELPSPDAALKRAASFYRVLDKQNPTLAGRGFVLNLVADLVARDDVELSPTDRKVLPWLMEALCRRETLRQDLPITAEQQLGMMRLFATMVAEGSSPNDEIFELYLYGEADLDTEECDRTMNKLQSHPLLRFNTNTGFWNFKEEQVGTFLLAEEILTSPLPKVPPLVRRLELQDNPGTMQDLASTLIDLQTHEGDDRSIREVVTALRVTTRSPTDDGPRMFAGRLSLLAVDALRKQGLPKIDRTEFLQSLAGDPIEGLSFSGTIASYDLRGAAFRDCLFSHVTFAQCVFDASTAFDRCAFVDGVRIAKSKGFQSSSILGSCHMDGSTRQWLRSIMVTEGTVNYSEDDLRADIDAVVGKFLSKGGMMLRTIGENDLYRGTIQGSIYGKEIIDEMKNSILARHSISGTSSSGLHVTDEAAADVRFYATNNNYTGILKEVFDKLARKLL